MSRILVLERAERWPAELPGVEVVAARDYLTLPRFSDRRRLKVFNLCRTYGYQTVGYYVSLLAAARGHRPLPSIDTLQDLRFPPLVRIVADDLDALITRALAPLRSDRFELSIYFGRNLARRYDRLARALFNQYPAPMLRASFVQDGRWRLRQIRAIATGEVPDSHWEFVIQQATDYLRRPAPRPRKRREFRYDLAILFDPKAEDSPSDERTIARFVRAAGGLAMDATVIGREDYGRVAEFDGLFIRETTQVDHHTYRFARRAAAKGLVVVDDPVSIVRCTNKVFQAELFARHEIPMPRTVIVHAGNLDDLPGNLGYPLVLKRPDGAFSRGVFKVSDRAAQSAALEELLEDSELVVAQEFAPSEFDWRIGVLGGEALWACRYHMAHGHWQIAASGASGRRRWGKVDAVALEDVPADVMATAVRAAGLIGDGLYGVDLKVLPDGRLVVMEVNDNPNIDVGVEDQRARTDPYEAIMAYFRQRLDARGGGES